MRRSGYKTIFHIYLMFFLALLSTIILTALFFFSFITIKIPDGSIVRSDFPKTFTEHFYNKIIYIDNKPQLNQSGMKLLQDYKAGIQILNSDGEEIVAFQTPDDINTTYSSVDLLKLNQNGHLENNAMTSFIGSLSHNQVQYTYIIHFPANVSKVTMYLNGENFVAGKTIFMLGISMLFAIILVSGIMYGFWITKAMTRISKAIKEIAKRNYYPITSKGSFTDVFDSLNHLDDEIKMSDHMRKQTETVREEWIANITHDLKTPLSPIKGYAELLLENKVITQEQINKYADVILKNVFSIESLIEDLKLTYQLDNDILPLNLEKQDVVRFLKELIIDILNNPQYENRLIQFALPNERTLASFDHKLMTRALQNVIINAFIHGNADTEIILHVTSDYNKIQMIITDNGKGMSENEVHNLFQRYYRGTNTEQNTAGTGLGLAITKRIVEAHKGCISVESKLGVGTSFIIDIPQI